MTETPIGRRTLLREGTVVLRKAGVDGAEQEARFLLYDAEGIDSSDIVLSPEAPTQNAELYRGWIARRAAGEPSSRITGFRNFRGLDFAVSPATLDPRQDSEVLVDAVLEHLPAGRDSIIVDVGTGSGCLILSILSERPQARGIGIDLSFEAASSAQKNASRLGLDARFLAVSGSWLSPVASRCADIVVSNPPYIRRGDIDGLDSDVTAYDPILALDGGPDGLDGYRAILPKAVDVLKAGGICAVEIGWDQGPDVQEMMLSEGLEDPRTICDLGDRDRVVIGRKKDLD